MIYLLRCRFSTGSSSAVEKPDLSPRLKSVISTSGIHAHSLIYRTTAIWHPLLTAVIALACDWCSMSACCWRCSLADVYYYHSRSLLLKKILYYLTTALIVRKKETLMSILHSNSINTRILRLKTTHIYPSAINHGQSQEFHNVRRGYGGKNWWG